MAPLSELVGAAGERVVVQPEWLLPQPIGVLPSAPARLLGASQKRISAVHRARTRALVPMPASLSTHPAADWLGAADQPRVAALDGWQRPQRQRA